MIEVGQTVRIRFEKAEGYVQPLRRWAAEGRTGTVVGISGGGEPVVMFSSARPPKRQADYRFSIFERDLEVVPLTKEGSK